MPRAGSETWDATRKNGDSNYLCFENGGRGETRGGGELVGTLAKETRSANPPLTMRPLVLHESFRGSFGELSCR